MVSLIFFGQMIGQGRRHIGLLAHDLFEKSLFDVVDDKQGRLLMGIGPTYAT